MSSELLTRRGVMAIALVSSALRGQEHGDASFTVASIRPSPSDARQSLVIQPGGRVVANGFQLKALIAIAWRLRAFQLSGGDGWMSDERWNIEATSDGVGEIPAWVPPFVPDAIGVRLRSLLLERFALKFHRETRMQQAYALRLAKGGSKLIPGDGSGPNAGKFRAGPGIVMGSAVSMEQFVTYLDRLMDRPVIDQTGVAGRFDFKLQFAPESAPRTLSASPPDGQPSEAPSLFTAIQEQLGLKLEAAREAVEIFVIDSARQPSEN